MREHLATVVRTGRRVVDACDRPSMYAAGTLLAVVAGAFLGMAGNGRAFGSIVFVAALFATQGFLRYGWPRVQRFHERREPDERDPTSMRFQGFSADVRVFLTLFVAVALVVAGLVLLELSLA